MQAHHTFNYDVVRGRMLYENHCVVCHTPKVHRRIPLATIDREDLRRIVSTFARQENLRWNANDVADVTAYLERTHYRIEGRPPQ